MKNKIIVFLLVITAIFACGCGEKQSKTQDVSYLQSAVLYGSEGNISVTVKAGERETPQSYDGKRGEMKEFCLIRLKPDSAPSQNGNWTYSFSADGKEYSGELKRDPFGNSYSADVKAKSIADVLTTIKVSDGTTETVISLDNMMGDVIITAEDALEIAQKEMQTELEKEKSEGKTREIHVKYINDSTNPDSQYFWYVAFIGESNDYWALLINPSSGEIVAKRI